MADDDQGALPTDTSGPTDNATAPPSQWGQSLGQDVSNVGGAISGQFNQVTGQIGQAASDVAGTVGNAAQRIKSYITGGGAMPADQYDSARQQDIKQGMDPDDATAHVVAAGGPPALQAARHSFDTAKGYVQKQLSDGNLQLAADGANQAFQHFPDGTKTTVALGKDGTFDISVHTPNGANTTDKLTPDELNGMFSGNMGFYDHMLGAGVNGVLDKLNRVKHPEGAFGGPPANATPPSPSAGPIMGPTQEQRDEGPPEKPTPVAPAGTPEPNPATWQSTQGGIGHWKREPTFTNPDQKTDEEINTPVRVIRNGTIRFEGGELTPEQQRSNAVTAASAPVQEYKPGTPGTPATGRRAGKAGTPGSFTSRPNTGAIADLQGLDRETNTETRANAATQNAQIRGNYALQVAEKRAQQMANHPQSDMAGQGRNAVKVLSEIRQMNPSISAADLDNELRHRGINPTNILKPFTPEEQGTPQVQPQQQQPAQQQAEQAPQDPTQRQAGKVYSTPKGPLRWTGTGWIAPQ